MCVWGGGGLAGVVHFITGNEHTQLNLIFMSFMYISLPKDLTIRTYLSSLQLVLFRVAAVIGLPVHHQSADYIFWSFGIIGLIKSHFDNRVLKASARGDWSVL